MKFKVIHEVEEGEYLSEIPAISGCATYAERVLQFRSKRFDVAAIFEVYEKSPRRNGICDPVNLIAPHAASRLCVSIRVGGFTLIELIMVMVIIGILAVSVLPRFADQSIFYSRGFHDETMALLRYAQKTAIAQRRTVCVAFTTSTATLTIASAAGSSICSKDLAGPNGAAPFSVTAKSGINYASVPTGFNFDALGNPSASQTLQVSGAAKSITIEATTGYVHE